MIDTASQETALVARAKRELPYRTGAFTELMKMHERRVFHTAIRFLHHEEDARDAAQDVWLRVFHALPRFEGRSAFTTWLYQIVRNVCITRDDKRRRRRDLGVKVRARGTDRTTASATEGLLGLDEALSALSDEDQEVLILRYMSGLSVEHVAEALTISESAAKMRLKRARDRLERLLAGGEYDGR